MLKRSATSMAIGAAAILGPASADEIPDLAPFAFIRFCDTSPDECVRTGPLGATIELTPAVLAMLDAVNVAVNTRIRPDPSSSGAYWQIDPPTGDCNDYAVTKRHHLIATGLPASALRLAAVKTLDGQDHLVLIARAKDGSRWVLDNLVREIRPLSETGYRVVKQQSGQDPRLWVEPQDRRAWRTSTAALPAPRDPGRPRGASANSGETGRKPPP